MRVGERGQVMIPKGIREQFGIRAETEVEFRVEGGEIILRKSARKLQFDAWKGRCGKAFRKSGSTSVDGFLEDVRGC